MALIRLVVERIIGGEGRIVAGPEGPGGIGRVGGLVAAILVDGSTIVAVGPVEQVARPEGSREIAMPGATALPGLIDLHVHVTFSAAVDPVADLAAETDEQLVIRGAVAAERMLRAGVTTAVDLGGRGSTTFAIRDGLARGLALGPRLLVAGRPVTPTGGHCHFFGGSADGPTGVREAIARLLDEEAADLIKIMATGGAMTAGTDPRRAAYPREVLRAAADEAHRRGRIITAHAHGIPGIRDASEAGIDSIQHGTMVGPSGGWEFDEPLARMLVRNGTRVIPTMAAGIRMEIESETDWNAILPNRVPGAFARIENGKSLREAGVRLLAGTDAGVNQTDFGEEILLEIEAFVEAGFSPLGAISAATGASARFLGLETLIGDLRPGLSADVLVVEGDPSVDIGRLRYPRLILRAGQPIQPTTPPPPPRPRPSPSASAR